MKKLIIFAMMAAMAISALTACGNENKTESAAATADEASYVAAATVETLAETDQAVVDAGLSVDENGNVVDKNGNKVEKTADGKVEVKTSDGKTVTVNPEEVKTANENKTKVDAANQAAPESEKSNSNTNTSANDSAQTSQSSKSTQSSQTSKTAQSGQSSQTSKSSQASQSQQSSQAQATTTDPHAGKTYHPAVYKTVTHPAETKQVKVVDKAAYTYEEPVYETKRIGKCKDCGANIFEMSDEEQDAHAKAHVLAGGDGGWYSTTEQVQVGTKTVTVPEQYHMETKVVKEAWTEQVLVKEAGWY